MSHLIRGAMTLLILLSLTLPLAAQELLSLADAIRLGLENNYQIRIAEGDVEVAHNNNSWGEAGRYPTITFSARQNNRTTEENPVSPFALSGRTVSNTLTGTIDIGWTIFEGFRVFAAKDRLEELERQSDGNAALIIENTTQAIILAYNTALLERGVVDVNRRVLELSRDRFQYQREQLDIGVGSTFDILQVKNAYLTDSANFIRARLAFGNAVRNLNLLLARDAETAYRLSDSLAVDRATYTYEDLFDKMTAGNATLRNQYINLRIMQHNVDLQRSVAFPRIAVNLGGNATLTQLDIKSRPDGFGSGDSYDYYVNFSLNFTLYDGLRISRSIENARVRERIAELQIEELQHTLSGNLRQQLALYNVRLELLNIADENLTSAELNLELATERYNSGSITSFEYRDIQVAYVQTAVARLQALYDIIEAETELTRLTGGFVRSP